MDSFTLPRIMDNLNGLPIEHLQFVKPSKERREIFPLYIKDTSLSPAAKDLSIFYLDMKSETIIPFHMNSKKEKCYILEKGLVKVLMLRFGKMVQYNLRHDLDNRVVVPVGTPHALINSCIDSCRLLVIASVQADDCTWEIDLEQLLKNEHRKK